MVCGLWFVVCGLWFVVCGLWFAVQDLRGHFKVCGFGFALEVAKGEASRLCRRSTRERFLITCNCDGCCKTKAVAARKMLKMTRTV